VLNIDGGVDYRLQFLQKANIYFTPINKESEKGLAYNFSELAPEEGKPNHPIEVLGRQLQTKRWADGVVWFTFAELCETPRSQNDYIELARRFHTLILEKVPVFDQYKEDSARRLINLIDVFYEHNVKLILSAEAVASELYIGRNPQVTFEFDRTVSRLTEMQSVEYLAKAHIS
jgi:cell division protein ZapE